MKVIKTAGIGCALIISAMMCHLPAKGFAQQGIAQGEREVFIQRFDQNGDGLVSRDEFPGPDEDFTQMDLNGDGYIDEDEVPKGPPPRGDFIQRFDQDNDGRVSQDEFPGPDEDFTQMDLNGDGYIDEDEAPKGPPPRGDFN